MKKVVLISFVIFSSNAMFSQTFEEKMAIEVCNCLSEFTKANNENLSKCMGDSFAKVFFDEKEQTVKEKAGTVEGITQIMKDVNVLLTKTCNSEKEKKITAKRTSFYTDSSNKTAQNFYTTGKDMMNIGKYELAIEGFEFAIKEDNQFVLAYDDMAASYRQLKDYENAIKYYKKSLAIYPEGNFALMNIGVVYSLKSDAKNAVKYYEKLIQYEPNNGEGYYGAGKNYFELKEYEKALNNIFAAHRIYLSQNSEYKNDSEKIMASMYQQLKNQNKEDLFLKIAKENNITIN